MVTNREKLIEFEKELWRREKPDYRRNLTIYEALHREAVTLGVLPLSDPLEDIGADIELARLGAALSAADIPYMIIGGQAVLLYGEPRLTKDIDVALGVGDDQLPSILDVADRPAA